MKIVQGIIAAVAGLIVLFVVIGLLLPREATAERSTVIDAPPEAVFLVVNDISRFNEWSPWADVDPTARYDFSGPASGVGARMEWTSDEPSAGTGAMEITESVPHERVRKLLDFGDMGQATTEYRLEPADGGTRITWSIHTDFGNNPVARWYGLFFDAMIGPDYEEGLENLKNLVEPA